jgi:hypothetical protein
LRRLIADAARNPVTGAKPAQSGAVPGIDDAAGTPREPVSLPATSASLPLIAAAQPSAGGGAGAGVVADLSQMPDIGSKWWSVLTTVGKIGLTTLAPEVALPASAALTAAGYVFGQLKKRRGEAAKAEFFRANRTPARDVTEVEQQLSLRQQECRDPLSDAMFGVLFEDLSREDANKTVGQAWAEAQQRFNRLAPLSSKSATITSSTKEK